MGLYTDRLFPGLIHVAMRQEQLLPLRQQVAGAAHGRVLELGIGSGLNLPLYGRLVTALVGVDPAERLLARARISAAWMPFSVTLIRQSAEHLPFESRSFDCAVTTWCLCSIADPLMALCEVRRVLRPGGELLFVEHGRSPRPGVRRWQERLSPAWQRLAGGCHLDRPMAELISQAGFRLTSLESGPLVRAPAIFAWHYQGRARP